jgi:YfiH family protein
VAELSPRGSIEVLELAVLAALGVEAFVTSRLGGVSSSPYDTLNLGLHVGDEDLCVLENRARLAAAARCHLDDLVFMDQVHGNRVAVVGEEQRGRGARVTDHALSATDAMVTSAPGLPLVVLVADCSPLVLVDPEAGVLGVAHAGWRGTVAGVAGATVEAMVRLGAEPTRTIAVVGPTISQSAYEVGPEVAAGLRQLGEVLESAIAPDGERFHVDLAEANRLSLLAAGLKEASVLVRPERSDDPEFFSDRAARPCGRFGILARLVG